MKYQVITNLARIPFIKNPKASLFEKANMIVFSSKQYETWRLVVKYFTQANGTWDEAQKTVSTETEFQIVYNAKDKQDAERELESIKNNAFKNHGALALDRLKRRFKKFNNIADNDPQFEKLRNNLANMNIYLDVFVSEIIE